MYTTHQNSPSFVPEMATSHQGFVPPQGLPHVVFGRDVYGRPVVLADPSNYDPRTAYESDLHRLRALIQNHDWYFMYHADPMARMRGYQSEQEIDTLVRRYGGVFSTIWETERSRHLVRPNL